jgi:hypothetical protein
MTMPANRTQPSCQMMVDSNFLACDRVVHVPALEPGPAALAEGILHERVECSGGGRLRAAAGQMVFDPAVSYQGVVVSMRSKRLMLGQVRKSVPASGIGRI